MIDDQAPQYSDVQQAHVQPQTVWAADPVYHGILNKMTAANMPPQELDWWARQAASGDQNSAALLKRTFGMVPDARMTGYLVQQTNALNQARAQSVNIQRTNESGVLPAPTPQQAAERGQQANWVEQVHQLCGNFNQEAATPLPAQAQAIIKTQGVASDVPLEARASTYDEGEGANEVKPPPPGARAQMPLIQDAAQEIPQGREAEKPLSFNGQEFWEDPAGSGQHVAEPSGLPSKEPSYDWLRALKEALTTPPEEEPTSPRLRQAKRAEEVMGQIEHAWQEDSAPPSLWDRVRKIVGGEQEQ